MHVHYNLAESLGIRIKAACFSLLYAKVKQGKYINMNNVFVYVRYIHTNTELFFTFTDKHISHRHSDSAMSLSVKPELEKSSTCPQMMERSWRQFMKLTLLGSVLFKSASFQVLSGITLAHPVSSDF
jgi:hypothetical protein